MVELGAPKVDIPQTKIPETPRPNIGITITHHLPDFDNPAMSLEDNGGFSQTCEKRQKEGADIQRFDIRWNRVVTDKNGPPDIEYLRRSAKIAEIGNRAGLENNIVLSSAPKWALELAKKDPEAFLQKYTDYVDVVFSTLAHNGGKPPAEIQIFNELNMKNYTPDALLPHIASCVDIVNAKALEHFGNKIPLVATLQVSAPLSLKGGIPFFMEGALNFIKKRQDILTRFDEVKLDYYPGIWHTPKKTLDLYLKNMDYFLKAFKARNDPAKVASLVETAPIGMFRQAFGNMELLEETLKALQPLQEAGKTIGIGEIGFPSIVPFETDSMKPEHQKLQTLAMIIVGWKLRPLLKKFHVTDIGFYSEMDEPTPELGAFDWGIVDKTGKPKHIADSFAKLIARIKAP